MRKLAAEALLSAMSARYDYDVTYMREMLRVSPKAFFSFAKIFGLSRHREAAPVAALYAAKLVGALAEDCGPCTQLVVKMAREAKVPASDIEALLRRDFENASADAALGYRFAEAVAHRLPEEDDLRDAVGAAWGDKGVIDLSLAYAVSRIYPMTKAGLGHAKECRRVEIDGRPVDVLKRAA